MLSTIQFSISVFAKNLDPGVLSRTQNNQADLRSNEIWAAACRARIETWKEILRLSYDEHIQACNEALFRNSPYFLELPQAQRLAESVIALVDLGGFSSNMCLELSSYEKVGTLDVMVGPLVNISVANVERNLIVPVLRLWAASYLELLPGSGVDIGRRRVTVGELATWAIRELDAIQGLVDASPASLGHPYR
jgi:hypothetical protein